MKTITISDDQTDARHQRRITFETTLSGNVEVKVNESVVMTIPRTHRDAVAATIEESTPVSRTAV